MRLARMHAALTDFHIVGVANNVDFLSRLVANDAFARGDVHTGLIEQERERLFPNADRDEPQSPDLARDTRIRLRPHTGR